MTNKRGFILLEVIVALAVLTGGILFIIRSLSMITSSNKNIRYHTGAVVLTDSIINRLQAGENVDSMGSFLMLNKNYRYSVETTNVRGNRHTVAVRVSWEDGRTQRGTHFVHTLLTQKE